FIMPAAIASFASGKAVNTVVYQAQSLQNDSAIILYYAFPQIFYLHLCNVIKINSYFKLKVNRLK
ncbi:hypothetical protein MJL81_33625, partial [Salmonella enterica subsp. enterica serovar Anatum]|nr:hypothetical protein [Salmonella enterica subsp. enterica serovar Anatum]